MDPSAGGSALAGIVLEMLFVVFVSVILAVLARCLYSLVMYPSERNPLQRLALPGEDEGRRVNEALRYELILLRTRHNAGQDIEVAQAYLVSHLAEASARRGQARLLADGISYAAIVFASVLAFAPMAKALLGSIL